MKKITLTLLLLALLLPASALAHDFEVDGIYYNIINCNEVEVTYMGDNYWDNPDRYTGDVTIPSTVSYNGTTYTITFIGENSFRECGLTKVTIPNSVTAIGYYAFFYSSLSSVNIGNSVTTIGNSAFLCCDGLKSVTIPDSVITIDDYAFAYCRGLTKIIIGNSVAAIDDGAFDHCESLISVNIPNSVTNINDGVFRKCYELKSVTIGNSVSTIGNGAFDECSGITDLIWNARNCPSNGNMPTFNIERVTIGNEVEVLPYNFASCSKITKVAIPNSVTTIGNKAFYDCEGLSDVTIGKSVTAFGDSVFDKCNGLTDLIWNARNCPSNGNMPTTNIERVTIGDEVLLIPDYFVWYSKVTSVAIPNSVTIIGNNAFDFCTRLTSVSIGNSVTIIGDYAFCDCYDLTSVIIPNSVKTIGNNAFGNCSAVENVTIGDSVTTIGSKAFYNCTSMQDLTLGKSVSSLGTDAFYNCTSLSNVKCKAATVPSANDKTFYNSYNQATLYVPYESFEDYQAHQEWGKFTHIIPFIGAGPGDVDGDGILGINDVTSLIDFMLSSDERPPYGDVNGDGIVDIADVTGLIDMLLYGN